MNRTVFQLSFVCIFLLTGSFLCADAIEFIPPNDPVGMVFTEDSNDAWASGRGIVFSMESDFDVSSVGLFHDLSGVELFWSISEVQFAGTSIDTVSLITSGNTNVSTDDLEWIDVSFDTFTFESGRSYHIDFSFDGNANQNFFYNNFDIPWTQGAFSGLDGTLGDSTANTVVPAIRLNANAIPEPANVMVACVLALAASYVRRRKRRVQI